uniref:Uncharacterized protein n=1 Tax=Anguilla anguilla TaxID=7936 RepID=A0A0E9X8A6_ANGAN
MLFIRTEMPVITTSPPTRHTRSLSHTLRNTKKKRKNFSETLIIC